MKKLYYFSAVATMAVAMLCGTACQEDCTEKECGYELIVNDTNYNPQMSILSKKGGTIRVESSVNVLTCTSSYKSRTLKIKDLHGNIMQEWFLDDLRTDIFFPYDVQSGDIDGSLYGYYYLWEPNFSRITSEDFDSIIFDDEGNAATGFHIPSEYDINNLASLIGGSSYIPTILQLQYDGTSHYGPAYSSKYTDFWVTCIYNKPVKGCGIFLQWDTNGKASYYFTNNEKLGANVRLVRTLTKWQ